MGEPKKVLTRHRSSKLILFLDKLAHLVITIGGMGTIFAVMTVFFFLLYVVYPLFVPASAQLNKPISYTPVAAPAYMGMDDDQLLAWALTQDAQLHVIDLHSGEIIQQSKVFADVVPTALTYSPQHKMFVAGFEDGSVRICTIDFKQEFLDPDQIEPEFKQLTLGETARRHEGVVYKTPSRQWRQTELVIKVDEALKIEQAAKIVKIDFTMSTSGPVIATYDTEHHVQVHRISERTNFMTMKVKKTLSSREVICENTQKMGHPLDMLLIGQGEYLLLVWPDAYSERYSLLDEKPYLAEQSRLVRSGNEINLIGRFIGRSTVIIGHKDGSVSAWFLAEQKLNADTRDGRTWQEGHTFEGNGSAVVGLNSSMRQRLALINYADGTCTLIHMTSERIIYHGPAVEKPLCASIAPKDDGLVICGEREMALIHIDAEHPDVTLSSLFLPVWYEGYSSPQTDWQSSSASDDAEAKLGLWPLIFGTLKATFYSLMFGVPIALAAAIYSSEFMSPRVKRLVKPSIEMMASLPSVVLGFLGGIIISMWMKEYVLDVLAALFVVPLCVVAAAYMVQLLPRPLMLQAKRWRLVIIGGPCFVVGWFLSREVASLAEQVLFCGDFMLWLEGEGNSFGGIWYLCLPISIVLVMLIQMRWLKPILIDQLSGSSVLRCAVVDLLKFMFVIVATILIAALLAVLVQFLGMDVRGPGNIFDRYETRNALVVGFMMAFAIIPIIYTIADDALSTVPAHLRAASLGCGGTVWQTAIRVVVPTAMSGLFSAVMVGLGRAIGETMIVLMAAGSTPIKDLNIFNGFKTLSANIASELPESVAQSTHYRTLFLSALVLFVITFVLNTVAEYIRARFRKKAVSL